MTKERLEELIKQGATVLVKTLSNRIIKVNTKGADVDVIDNRLYFNDEKWFPIKDVYFDEAELQKAEWHNKTYAERTERFEPPMWEDIKDKFDFRFVVNNECYKLVVYKTGNLIGIWNTTKKEDIYTALCEHCTKENYEKACEIVRDLFKGEK